MAGWWDSHEPFDPRKFMGTVWRALFAAMGFAFSNQFVVVTGAVWIWAFLGGAGVDVIGNRLQGGIAGKDPLAEVKGQLADVARRLEAVTAIQAELIKNLPKAATPTGGTPP
jgi:hypothetical protein